MPLVDRIIQFMQTQQGERIVLVQDQDCVIYRPGGASATVPQRRSLSQISTMLNEIMPDDLRPKLAAGESFNFPYAQGGGALDVEVSQADGAVRVSIGANGQATAPKAEAPAVAA